jgi:TonB family protein
MARHWLVPVGLLVLLVPVQAQQAQQTQTDEYNRHVSAGIVLSPGDLEEPRIHDVAPKYPKDAIAKGIQGVVRLRATIDRKGNVANVRVLEGDPILAEAAVKAVKRWKYRPHLLNGEAVEAETAITIQFHF